MSGMACRMARRGVLRELMAESTNPDASQSRAQVDPNDELLADMIASGNYYLNEACGVLGIQWRQVYRRINREPLFAELMEESQQAGLEVRRARLERIAAGDVSAGSSGDWKRDQLICKQGNWALEKLHPKKYGPKAELEVRQATITTVISDDPIEAARQYEQIMKPR